MSKQLDLKTLTDSWYKKLKSDGFEDIEQEDGRLKSWSSRFYTSQFKETNGTRAQDKISINSAKAEYYRLAEHFLYAHKFKDALEKSIWTLHSEGYSFRHISKVLNPLVKTVLNKDNVNSIIKELSKIMMASIKRDSND